MLTDGRTGDGRATDAGVIGILIAHLGAFGSGELILRAPYHICLCGRLHNVETAFCSVMLLTPS